MLNKKHTLLGNHEHGLLFVMSAPAGTGKTTLIHKLSGEFSCVVESISYTTRPPREGEVEGVHYHFVSNEQFEVKVAQGDFLEHVDLYGHKYGTSAKWVERMRSEGKHVFLVIDTQGGMKLKESTDAIFIFIMPPSIEVLKERLTNRKTETAEVIQKRLKWADKEIVVGPQYDYVIVNDHLETAYEVLKSIVIAEEHKKEIT